MEYIKIWVGHPCQQGTLCLAEDHRSGLAGWENCSYQGLGQGYILDWQSTILEKRGGLPTTYGGQSFLPAEARCCIGFLVYFVLSHIQSILTSGSAISPDGDLGLFGMSGIISKLATWRWVPYLFIISLALKLGIQMSKKGTMLVPSELVATFLLRTVLLSCWGSHHCFCCASNEFMFSFWGMGYKPVWRLGVQKKNLVLKGF